MATENVETKPDDVAARQLQQLVNMAHAAPSRKMALTLKHVLAYGGVGVGGFAALSPIQLDTTEVTAAFAMIREAIASMVDTGGWGPDDTLTGVRIHLLRAPDGRVTRLFRRAEGPIGWRPVLVLLLAALLEGAGRHLRRCPACQRVFVRRGRRDYCSPACSQRVRSAKHYQQKRDAILIKRAEAYARKRLPARAQSRRLQRIATEGLTGGKKTPEVRVASTKNARHSTRGKSGR